MLPDLTGLAWPPHLQAKRRARSKEASTRTSKHGFEVVPATASKKGAGSDSDASEGETDSEDEFDMLDDQVRPLPATCMPGL